MKLDTLLIALALFAAGCNKGEECVDCETDGDADTDTDSDTDADTDEDTDTPDEPWEPVAVAFELDSGWNAATGELTNYSYDGVDYYPPLVTLTFTDLEYFDSSTDTLELKDAHDCVVLAEYFFVPGDFETRDYETDELLPQWSSWEGYITFDTAFFETDDPEGNCTNWDPDEFPGGDPVETFSGMRLGFAFGPMADYLVQSWDEEYYAEHSNSMYTHYVAVNHPDDSFVGYTWNTGLLFEMDMETGVVPSDDEDLLIWSSAMEVGGYTRSSAYWYEDFPNLDFANLKDNVPVIEE